MRWRRGQKGRARRFREARQLKEGYDDGLFTEGSGTLADLEDADDEDDDLLAADVDAWSEFEDDEDDGDPLKIDQRRGSLVSESPAQAGRGSTASKSIS
jgi:hypothetical protein